MKDAINELNKNSISKSTGISYGRLRKYASGLIKDLTPEDQYLINLANRFKAN